MQPERISIVGTHYSRARRAQVMELLFARALGGGGGYVCVSNVHTTMTAFFSASYRAVMNGSLFTVPDGVPLVWAMRTLGAPEQDRVRGPSLMRDMMAEGRARGAKHYLYGGSEKAVAALKHTLEERFPGVNIVGAESPPFRPLEKISPEEWAETAGRLNRSGAHFVWVGLGAPKQELWMGRQVGAVQGVMLGVGAAFDLIPGLVPEAPEALQALGLEWAYRLFREPRRLWRRYILNNPLFLVLWGAQWLGAKILRRSYVVGRA